MHVGGIYFINHKTNEYFPEGAALLNLPVSTLKEKKSHNSQLSSSDTHYNREDYHRKHPASTRRPRDVLWRFPNGKPTRETTRGPQGTLRGPIQKLIILWKNCFSEVIVLVLHICFCLLQEEQIFKSSERGRPRDVYGTQLLDVHGTKWWDVLRTSVGRRSNMFFKLNSQTH